MTSLYRCCSLILIKPDAVARGLIGDIISRFERAGMEILYLDIRTVTSDILDQHYKHLVNKPYYPDIVKTMTMGPLIVAVVGGYAEHEPDFFCKIRNMVGATDPLRAAPGTIRGDMAMHIGRNICHASDSMEEARREMLLWTQCDYTAESTRNGPDFRVYREK